MSFQDQYGANSGAVDMTGADLSRAMGNISGGTVNVAFFWQRVTLQTQDLAKDGKIETRLCIAKKPKADRYTISHSFITEQQARRDFPEAYQRFMDTGAAPESGTPISDLPKISRSQVALLSVYGIYSIEDLADLSLSDVTPMGHEAEHAYHTAKAWLKNVEENGEIADSAVLEAKYEADRQRINAEIENKDKRIAALEAALAAVQRQGLAVSGPNGQPAVTSGEPLVQDNGGPDIDPNDDFLGGSGDAPVDGVDDLVGALPGT